NGTKSEAVHSHTLPIICRHPKALSPAAQAATSSGSPKATSMVAGSRLGAASPQGQRRLQSAKREPSGLASPTAAASHSASVGSLRLAQLHQACASYQLTNVTGACGGSCSCWSWRRHVQLPPSCLSQ